MELKAIGFLTHDIMTWIQSMKSIDDSVRLKVFRYVQLSKKFPYHGGKNTSQAFIEISPFLYHIIWCSN